MEGNSLKIRDHGSSWQSWCYYLMEWFSLHFIIYYNLCIHVCMFLKGKAQGNYKT